MSTVLEPYDVSKRFDYPYLLASKEFLVKKETIRLFCRITGDKNSLHRSNASAKEEGFKAAIAAGMFISSRAVGFITEYYSRPIAKEVHLYFIAPVYPGEVIKVSLIVTAEEEKIRSRRKRVSLEFVAFSPHRVVAHGTTEFVVRI